LPLPAGRPRYLPAEDTDLLREALESFSGDSCLEIGFGSGAALASAAGRFRLAVGTDVVALEEARLATRAGVQLVLADMATCFRDGVFDVVFFNPPYLPSETIEDRAVDGGPTGVEVPVSFLMEGLRVVREEGVIVALLSTEGDVGSFLARCRSLGLRVEPIAEKRLFYETLSVFRIQRGERSAGATKANTPPRGGVAPA
jgi:release factor glutamine methyltransferase